MKTYKEIIEAYPVLAFVEGSHEQIVLCAYLAGRNDVLSEDVDRQRARLARLERADNV